MTEDEVKRLAAKMAIEHTPASWHVHVVHHLLDKIFKIMNAEGYLADTEVWQNIKKAPKHEVLFICREKRKPHVQFEAAIFEDVESWEMPSTCYCLQNMTTDEPLTDSWDSYEWKPIPEGGE